MSLSFSQSLNAHAPPFVELFICWFCARRPRNSPSILVAAAIAHLSSLPNWYPKCTPRQKENYEHREQKHGSSVHRPSK
jgi:hypothetical protein